jgi:serine/threonine protein kinase
MTAAPAISRLGRYQLLRVLGQGAMGVVYEGLDPLLNRQVAVKTILRSALVDADTMSDFSDRFVREAQAIARLNHPNIVAVYDFGEEGDVAYFVMEFVRGRELKSYFDTGDFFDLGESIRVVGELLSALDFAHQQGVVHRDVKPANVMLDAERRVKLTDFGVARLADSNSDRTMAGTMVGTPSYMSPEQIQGLVVGSRTDLFAAGIILYQSLSGAKPFSGHGTWAVQKQIVHDDPLPLSVVNPQIDPRFDAIVARALAKDPAQRYASAAEFAADLRRTLLLVSGGVDERLPTLSQPPVVAPMLPTSPEASLSSNAEATYVEAENDEKTNALLGSVPLVVASAPAVAAQEAVTAPQRSSKARWFAVAAIAAVSLGVAAYLGSPARSPSLADVPAPESKAVVKAAPPLTPLPRAVPVVAAPPVVVTPEVTAPLPPLPVSSEFVDKTARPEKTVAVAESARVARAEAAAKSRPSATKSQLNPRCDDLMQRFQLGDGLSPEDLLVLQKECKK